VRGDLPAPGGPGDAVHHAPGIWSGQRLSSPAAQERPCGSPIHNDAHGAHDRHREWDVGGLATLADELEAVVAAVLAQ
jgi:hypothetical protein